MSCTDAGWPEQAGRGVGGTGVGGLAANGRPVRFLLPTREMPDHAVFISYAREDLAAGQQVKAGFDAAGITAWFDMERLERGDDFMWKIRGNVARCSYFIPLISAMTQRREIRGCHLARRGRIRR